MSVRMAIEAIGEKKGRSFLTMLGILIGVGAVLILVTVVTGMNADLEAYYAKLGVNRITVDITQYDRTNTVDLTSDFLSFAEEDLAGAAIGASPNLTTSGTLKYGSASVDTSTIYLGNEQWSLCSNYTIDKGRDLTTFDIEQRSDVCIIGSYVADTLFGYADPVGKTITFNGAPLLVVGTYYQKDGGESSSMDDAVLLPYTLNRSLLGTSSVDSFLVKMETSDQVDGVMAQLESWLEEHVNSNTGTYTLTDGNAQMSSAEDETTSLSLVLAGVAAISLLVGGIGIMNIMLVTVTERTREIGIKKAIGAQRSLIVTQFLVEAGILSTLGGAIGIAIGYAGSLLIGKLMYDLILTPSPLYTAAAALFSVAIGLLFGIYPALKASALQPVDALRAD